MLHVRAVEYLDIEVLPDEREEGGGEVDLALPVQWHVHPNQLFVGQPDKEKLSIGVLSFLRTLLVEF